MQPTFMKERTMNWTRFSRIFAGAALACGVLNTPSAAAQSAAIVLLLDQNAIAVNKPPNNFVSADINANIASVGVRDPLPFFMKHQGQNVVLPGGSAGHEGWFATGAMPASWNSAAGNDAPQQFMLAAAGIGSPDATASRTTLLGSVGGLAPLGATRLQTLVGQTVCAVVFSTEIPYSASGTSLKGATLGTVAFSIVTVANVGGDVPSVTVRVLDFDETCAGALTTVSF
jgi:hypothetical protein